jgi:glucose/arabinose dehydrogenase
VLAVLGVLLLAEAVRLPYLWEIPRFTDETAEAGIGLSIARGERWPLTNRDPYIGALWNFLVAGAFKLSGPSLYTPRLVVVILGVLTVIPTWLLAMSAAEYVRGKDLAAALPASGDAASGRAASGRAAFALTPSLVRMAGLMAGLFLALAPAHIVVNSHIAWSNCVTPLFTTLALWLTHRALRMDRPHLLPWAGLVWGLALQTHPVAVLFYPGVALAVALTRPGWLRGRWPILAILAAILGSANLLVGNLLDGMRGLTYGGAVQAQYTGGEILTWAIYLDRLRQTLWLVTDSLGGILVESGALAGPVAQPAGLAIVLVAACGIEALCRRRDPLLLLAVLSYVLLLPVINGRFESLVPKARYIMPLLPIIFAGAGLALVQALSWAGRPYVGHSSTPLQPDASRTGGASDRRTLSRLLLRSSVTMLALGLLLFPLSGLVNYYTAAVQSRRTNTLFFQAVNAIEASRRAGDHVYVERNVQSIYTLGGGQWHEHLVFAASVYGWNSETLDWISQDSQNVRRIVGPVLVRTGVVPIVGKTYRIEPVPGSPAAPSPIRVIYSRGPLPELVGARRQDDRDDVPQPPRPPRVETFVSGVAYPSALQFAPDGRLFFNEVREGRVRIASPAGLLQPEPFVTLSTTRGLDQGALGLALDPDFVRNHWVYVFFSDADSDNRPIRNRLVRFTERGGLATDPTMILDNLPINPTSAFDGGHNGGRIAFGPDRKLYVSVGEMVRRSLVRDTSTVVGKILRINRDGTVPSDNPFPPFPMFALGFQNADGLAFHPLTGKLYAADIGSEGYDELNLVLAGHDYGYPTIEGGPGATPGLDDPIWDSGEEQPGITGLTIFSGRQFPEYNGDLFFCARNTGALRRARVTGPNLDQVDWIETIAHDCRLDVTTGPDGTLYFSDLTQVFRLVR